MAVYKKNITLHGAINNATYEVVFSMLPRKEMLEGAEDHTDEREQFTTLEKENAPTLLNLMNPAVKMTFHHLLKMLT